MYKVDKHINQDKPQTKLMFKVCEHFHQDFTSNIRRIEYTNPIRNIK